jgi:hypothetical protein
VQPPGEWCHLRKTEQNLIEQMRSTFGEGNTQQDRKIGRVGSEAQSLRQFFRVIYKSSKKAGGSHAGTYSTQKVPS